MNNWLKDYILYGWELSIDIDIEAIIFSLASIPFMFGVFDIFKGIFPPDDKKDFKFLRLLHIIRGCLCITSSFFIMYLVLFLKALNK